MPISPMRVFLSSAMMCSQAGRLSTWPHCRSRYTSTANTFRGCTIGSLTHPSEYRCSFDELILALQWGANDFSQRGRGFLAGQVVTTGSPHVPVEATAGSEIIIRYGDAGEIKAKFE